MMAGPKVNVEDRLVLKICHDEQTCDATYSISTDVKDTMI
jgi:hypothetical protein